MKEQWKPVKGFEGKYIVSNFGNVMCLFKSQYVPEYSLSENILKKNVTEIYWTPNGIALGVEDGED